MSLRTIMGWLLAVGFVAGPLPALAQDPPQAESEPPSQEQPAEQSGQPDEKPAAQDPPRPMTRSELQRELDLSQRELEELVVRIGETNPTLDQRVRAHELTDRIAELRKQLEASEAKVDEKIEAGGNSFKVKWLRLSRAAQDFTTYDVDDGMFRIRVGMSFQFDATAGTEDDALEASVGTIDESVNLRRGRIYARGRLFRIFDFDVSYDFAADAGPKDMYLEGSKYVKIFKWRIGKFREPFSLSRQNSSNDLPFLEWPLPVQAIAPGRNVGIMLRHNESQPRLTWAASATTNGRSTDDNRSNAKFTLTGRATGLPVFRDEGRRLLHVGLSLSLRNPSGDQVEYSARPEARFAPFFVDTGPIDADAVTLVGVEFLTVQKQYWLKSEAIRASISTTDSGRVDFGGAYVEAGMFLTGESRPYDMLHGTFDRVVPNRLFKGGNPFKSGSNGGAIELTGRVSLLDLNDGPYPGGEMRNFGVGMNWYLTQSSRLMINYIHSKVLDVGSANIVLLRYQFRP